LGYDFTQPIPHFTTFGNTTFGKNYVRRFRDTDIFESIFARILEEAVHHGFVEPDILFIDATHVKVNANKNKIPCARTEQEIPGTTGGRD
jgi:isocitrate dehydrogenase kinase/phosphatase